MSKSEIAAEVSFGMIAMLLMWWFLGDILDTYSDPFLAVIAFGAAIVATYSWINDLFSLLANRGGGAGAGGSGE